MTIDHRAARISDAINAAFARVGELNGIRIAGGGQMLPPDERAADLYGQAAELAEALAADLRQCQQAFRPIPGVDQDPGGAA